MRCKIQARRSDGVYQDIIIDPSRNNLLCLDFTPDDFEFINKRPQKGDQRLHLPAIPMRVKTRVSEDAKGTPIDLIADRTAGDWISLELTPHDRLRLLQHHTSQHTRKIVYAGPNGKNALQRGEIDKFKSEWPDIYDVSKPGSPDWNTGIPPFLNGDPFKINAFMAWALDWPPVFHSTEKAPEAKLILPDGVTRT